jgi:hypothetical protein
MRQYKRALDIPELVRDRVAKIVARGDRAVVGISPSGAWRVSSEAGRRRRAETARRVKPWTAGRKRRRKLAFEPADLGIDAAVTRQTAYGDFRVR